MFDLSLHARLTRWACAVVFLVSTSCCSRNAVGQIAFEDASDRSGLQSFRHEDGSTGQHFLVEAVASGMASFDYDRDGRSDLLFLSGNDRFAAKDELGSPTTLFRNVGDRRFSAVSFELCPSPGYGLGVAAGDVNNDGFSDLYINNCGSNELLINNGDGTFTPAASREIQCGDKVGAGVSMLDMDGDGDLDIYVASYIQFTTTLREPEQFHGRIVYGGPVLYPPESDNLLENMGDGTFRDVSETHGIGQVKEWGMGTIALDFDNDEDTDILVANDSTANTLWLNDGTGKFENASLLAGFAYNAQGDSEGSMGLDAADLDGDGYLDVVQTSYEDQTATLYSNLAFGSFQDLTVRSGGIGQTKNTVNWGCGFADFDNDGLVDAFFANGHIHDNLDEFNDQSPYRMPNVVFRGRGNLKFAAPSPVESQESARSSRGLALDDFDGDGQIDVAVLNSRSTPTLLMNASETKAVGERRSEKSRKWIEIELIGVEASRDAVGTRVQLYTGGKIQTLERVSGRGYQSHFGDRLHFGFEDATSAARDGESDAESIRIVVHWPGGDVQEFVDPPLNLRIQIVQGNPELNAPITSPRR